MEVPENDKGNPNNCLVLPKKQNNSYLYYSSHSVILEAFNDFYVLVDDIIDG